MWAEMVARAKCIEVAAQDRPVLEGLVGSRTAKRRLVERARIVLLAGEGRPASEIADRVGCVAETARRQRARYEREGLDGLEDRPKSGRALTHDLAVRARLIALACTRASGDRGGAAARAVDAGQARRRGRHVGLARAGDPRRG